MKIQRGTLDKELRMIRAVYNKGSMSDADKQDQDEAFFIKLEGFDVEIVQQVMRNYSGKYFPTAGDIVPKCWDLKKKRAEAGQKNHEGQWHCATGADECKSWPINANQASTSRLQFNVVYCYLCEEKMKAKNNPGGIEDLWIKEMESKGHVTVTTAGQIRDFTQSMGQCKGGA